jgi:hypothetical protein
MRLNGLNVARNASRQVERQRALAPHLQEASEEREEFQQEQRRKAHRDRQRQFERDINALMDQLVAKYSRMKPGAHVRTRICDDLLKDPRVEATMDIYVEAPVVNYIAEASLPPELKRHHQVVIDYLRDMAQSEIKSASLRIP